jgi:sugar phosphate isomerase/epimerase
MKTYYRKLLLVLIVAIASNTAAIFAQKTPEALGWQLATQTYSFRLFTFEEALNKADSIGIKFVQAFPGQRIGAGMEGTMDFKMPAARIDSVLQLARKKGIQIVSYGVVSPRTEGEWRQLFTFLKGMGLKQFASEPEPEFIPLVSKLADEFQINVAIHDHPRPSRYWSPDTLIKYTAGYSKRLGACADVGHWVRSGLDPVACLKKLQGRVFELHMKDLHEKPSAEYAAFLLSRPPAGQGGPGGRPGGPGGQPGGAGPGGQPGGGGLAGTGGQGQGAGQGGQRPGGMQMPAGPHDVPWGKGVSNIKGVLEELKRQNFKGPIIAEYEHNWTNNAPEIAESVQYVREVVKNMK